MKLEKILWSSVGIGLFLVALGVDRCLDPRPKLALSLLDAELDAQQVRLSELHSNQTPLQTSQPTSLGKTTPDLGVDLAALTSLNPEVVTANPKLDFASTFHKAIPDELVLPRATRFVLMKDANCPVSALERLGFVTKTKLNDYVDRQRGPSFFMVSTGHEQLWRDLRKQIETDRCIHGIQAAGTMPNVAGDPSSIAFSARSTEEAPLPYDRDRINNSGIEHVQIYILGSKLPVLAIFTDSTMRIKIRGKIIKDERGDVFNLPLPMTPSGDAVTDLSNSILLATNLGAHFILIPIVDPKMIHLAIRYAKANGAELMWSPLDAESM